MSPMRPSCSPALALCVIIVWQRGVVLQGHVGGRGGGRGRGRGASMATEMAAMMQAMADMPNGVANPLIGKPSQVKNSTLLLRHDSTRADMTRLEPT